MDITLNFAFVNWFAVLAATVAAFLIGGAWFSPALFGRAAGVVHTAEAAGTGRNMPWIFVGAFVLWWLAASVMAAVLGPNATTLDGFYAGMLIGLLVVTPAMGITYIFEKRSARFWVVNGGYHTVTFTVIGTILGAWN